VSSITGTPAAAFRSSYAAGTLSAVSQLTGVLPQDIVTSITSRDLVNNVPQLAADVNPGLVKANSTGRRLLRGVQLLPMTSTPNRRRLGQVDTTYARYLMLSYQPEAVASKVQQGVQSNRLYQLLQNNGVRLKPAVLLQGEILTAGDPPLAPNVSQNIAVLQQVALESVMARQHLDKRGEKAALAVSVVLGVVLLALLVVMLAVLWKSTVGKHKQQSKSLEMLGGGKKVNNPQDLGSKQQLVAPADCAADSTPVTGSSSSSSSSSRRKNSTPRATDLACEINIAQQQPSALQAAVHQQPAAEQAATHQQAAVEQAAIHQHTAVEQAATHQQPSSVNLAAVPDEMTSVEGWDILRDLKLNRTAEWLARCGQELPARSAAAAAAAVTPRTVAIEQDGAAEASASPAKTPQNIYTSTCKMAASGAAKPSPGPVYQQMTAAAAAALAAAAAAAVVNRPSASPFSAEEFNLGGATTSRSSLSFGVQAMKGKDLGSMKARPTGNRKFMRFKKSRFLFSSPSNCIIEGGEGCQHIPRPMSIRRREKRDEQRLRAAGVAVDDATSDAGVSEISSLAESSLTYNSLEPMERSVIASTAVHVSKGRRPAAQGWSPTGGSAATAAAANLLWLSSTLDTPPDSPTAAMRCSSSGRRIGASSNSLPANRTSSGKVECQGAAVITAPHWSSRHYYPHGKPDALPKEGVGKLMQHKHQSMGLD
jgi:hypothetical protein